MNSPPRRPRLALAILALTVLTIVVMLYATSRG